MAAPIFADIPIPAFVKTYLSNLAIGYAHAKFTITFAATVAAVLTVTFSAVGVGRLRGETVTFEVPNANAGSGLSFLIAGALFFGIRYLLARRAKAI